MLFDRTNVQVPLGRSGPCSRSEHGSLARRNDESDGRIPGENGVEDMGSIISSIAQERSWRSFQLFQQWPDMRGVVDFLVGKIKSDDFITVSGFVARICRISPDVLNKIDEGRFQPGVLSCLSNII
jgi:hypothetical protein